MSLGKTGLFLAAVSFLGLAGCGAPAQPAGTEAVPMEAVPGVTGEPEDQVDAVDLAVGSEGVLHVVWREVDREPGGGLPRFRNLYVRGAVDGSSWSAPEELKAAGEGPARVFAGGAGVHVLSGRRLVHLYRGGDGAWQELGPLVPEGRLVAQGSLSGLSDFRVAADAVAVDDGLDVVYLARGGMSDPLGLDFVALRPGETPLTRRLAEFSGAAEMQAAPRLLAAGGRLHLLWAVDSQIRETVDSGNGPVEVYSAATRLFYLAAKEDGTGWGSPVEVTASLDPRPQTLDSVELLAGSEGLTALYSSHGLYLSRSADGRTWSTPELWPGFGKEDSPADSWSLTAAGGAVAWIDERFQDTGRRWWKPLGGWPWSDSPEGVENDVFLLPVSALAERGAEPRRLTPAHSFAFLVRLAASPGRLHVLWTGRRRVGKSLDSEGARPEVFYRVLTQDEVQKTGGM